MCDLWSRVRTTCKVGPDVKERWNNYISSYPLILRKSTPSLYGNMLLRVADCSRRRQSFTAPFLSLIFLANSMLLRNSLETLVRSSLYKFFFFSLLSCIFVLSSFMVILGGVNFITSLFTLFWLNITFF